MEIEASLHRTETSAHHDLRPRDRRGAQPLRSTLCNSRAHSTGRGRGRFPRPAKTVNRVWEKTCAGLLTLGLG